MSHVITIYHSPDADDAFMFYGLTSGAVTYPGYDFQHALGDIQSLNRRAQAGEVEVSAVSVHALAYLSDRYAVLQCGASMGGREYGPRVITRRALNVHDIRTVAIPGELTSAALAVRLYLRELKVDAEYIPYSFDDVQRAVREGETDAGVIIHEGQLTWAREGFKLHVDLGKWWWDSTNLPLPLGVNVVRKDLGPEAMKAAATVLRRTIDYSLAHRNEAIEYALSYGRGISASEADVFIGMYVNELTRDLGETGIKSIQLFLRRGREAGLLPAYAEPEFIAPE